MTRAEELLDKYMTGFEWEMENKPEHLDRADYEFYDEVKEYFNQQKQAKSKDWVCYEIWRPNIPDNGCKQQCKECKDTQERNT